MAALSYLSDRDAPSQTLPSSPVELAQAWTQRGAELKAEGRLEDAVRCYETAAEFAPLSAAAWSNLGRVQVDLKRWDDALRSHRRALELAPANAQVVENAIVALNAAGVTLRSDKKLPEAKALYREALALNDRQGTVWSNLGNLLLDESGLKHHEGLTAANVDTGARWALLEEAVLCQRRAYALEPQNPSFRSNLAHALGWAGAHHRGQGRFEEAISCSRELLGLVPENAAAWSNLGNALKDARKLESAIACHQRALASEPDRVEFLFNLAIAQAAGLQSKQAIETLDKGLALRPGDPHLRWDRALNYLRLGDYVRGFEDYEARFETGRLPDRKLPGVRWDGRSYKGQRLLVASEQGYGDAIWTARFLSRVKALGGELIVECRPALIPLLTEMGVADGFVAKGQPLPPADWHIYNCSLPGLFTRFEEDICGEAYLPIPGMRNQAVEEALAGAHGQLKVGIVWSGSTTFKENHDRAVSLTHFIEAFALPGVQLYSLQKGPPESELLQLPDAPVINLAPMLRDFGETAAVVARLDLVIMTDSSVAHLAGAIGTPVWVLLNRAPYWLWNLKSERSHWYSSMCLLRQSNWHDWRTSFDRASLKLLEIISKT